MDSQTPCKDPAKTLQRALSAPKRPKGVQERPKSSPDTTKMRLSARLGALLRRFGRVLSAVGEAQGSQN